MLAAVTDEERKEFLLNDYTAQDFKLINTSGTFDRRDGANDAQLFDQLVVCMYIFILSVFHVVVPLLYANHTNHRLITFLSPQPWERWGSMPRAKKIYLASPCHSCMLPT
jgi:hypothetical protein